MTSPLRKIAAFVPGPALTFAGKWIDLFSGTKLANPEWQADADLIALGAGAVATIYVCVAWADMPKAELKKRFGRGLAITAILLAACWAIRIFPLAPPAPGERAPDPTRWNDYWETAYVAALIFLVPSISTGALSIEENKSHWFWIVVGLCVLALVIAAIVYFRLF